MKRIRRLLAILLLLCVAALVLVFILENPQPVSPVLLGWQAPQVSLAVALCLALLAGLVLGVLLSGLNGLRLRRRLALQGQQLRKCRALLARGPQEALPPKE